MNILLIGSGGREHALAWKLAQSTMIGALYCAPGNGGTGQCATNIDLDVGDTDAVIRFCQSHDIALVVVGPEAPLVSGLVDVLAAAGIKAFGPSAAAAQLEGSKGFTKAICDKAGIPTAAYASLRDLAGARAYVESQGAPIVVKADGLAAGKGVTVAETLDDAFTALDAIFANDGAAVVIEEKLEGPEASLFVLCDGKTALPFGTAEDHKRAFDGDKGPNTGGMGAYSPSSRLTDALLGQAMAEIVAPTLNAMADAGTPYHGVLYVGLMLTADGPKLIEYNCRFGDPECQVLMMRLDNDLLPLLLACAEGTLDQAPAPQWSADPAITVVMASQGYPGAYKKGTPINGCEAAEALGATLFHAGTEKRADGLYAIGGRVLNVCAQAPSLMACRAAAYHAVDFIEWPQGFYRRDIAEKGL